MEVTQKYTSDSSKKKWILRLGIKNIPSMPKSGMKTTPKRIHFLESRTGKIKNLMDQWYQTKSTIKDNINILFSYKVVS